MNMVIVKILVTADWEKAWGPWRRGTCGDYGDCRECMLWKFTPIWRTRCNPVLRMEIVGAAQLPPPQDQ